MGASHLNRRSNPARAGILMRREYRDPSSPSDGKGDRPKTTHGGMGRLNSYSSLAFPKPRRCSVAGFVPGLRPVFDKAALPSVTILRPSGARPASRAASPRHATNRAVSHVRHPPRVMSITVTRLAGDRLRIVREATNGRLVSTHHGVAYLGGKCLTRRLSSAKMRK